MKKKRIGLLSSTAGRTVWIARDRDAEASLLLCLTKPILQSTGTWDTELVGDLFVVADEVPEWIREMLVWPSVEPGGLVEASLSVEFTITRREA